MRSPKERQNEKIICIALINKFHLLTSKYAVKKFFLALSALLFFTTTHAQNSFTKILSTTPYCVGTFYDILENANQDIIVGNMNGVCTVSLIHRFGFSKFTINGSVIWSKNYPNSSQDTMAQKHTVNLGNGTYLTAGFRLHRIDPTGTLEPIMACFNESGNILWTKRFLVIQQPGEYCVPVQLVPLGNGESLLVAAYSSVSSYTYLVKLDASGAVLWAKYFSLGTFDIYINPSMENFVPFTKSANDNIVLGAYNKILQVDTSGNIIQAKQFMPYTSNNFVSGMTTAHNNYYVSLVDGTILKLDSAFQVIWAKKLSGVNYLRQVVSASEVYSNSDRGCYFLGYDGIGRIDSIGNVEWAKTSTSFGTPNFMRMAYTSDKHLVIGHNQLLFKCDTLGTLPCFQSIPVSDSTVSFTTSSFNTSTALTSFFTDFQYSFSLGLNNTLNPVCPIITSEDEVTVETALTCFPNPATNELGVRTSEFGDKSVITILNTLGEKVITQITPDSSADEEQTINISSLSPGIYFVKVHGEKEERVAKFVKQ